MSTASHRSIEILVGFALVGYCSYSMYRGRIFGRLRFYTRREDPWSFWTIVIVALCVGIACEVGEPLNRSHLSAETVAASIARFMKRCMESKGAMVYAGDSRLVHNLTPQVPCIFGFHASPYV
jgi:hypothetical protein